MSTIIARTSHTSLLSDEVAHGADLNRINAGDRAIHEWYRFILSFPPHLPRHYLTQFGASPGAVLLDPFCGTATTLVEANKHGIDGIGIEANPLAALAARVKTDWTLDPATLRRTANAIAETSLSHLSTQGISDTGPSRPTVPLRGLDETQAQLLIKDSISALPLHKTLVLLDAIEQTESEPVRAALRLALARILPGQIGNLRFGPEVGVGTVKTDAAVVFPWLNAVDLIARDLELVAGTSHGTSRIIPGDARSLQAQLTPGSVDFVITSPPYPNEKDYTRTTRLESVLLGYLHDRSDLRAVKDGLIRSNSRTTFAGDTDDAYVADIKSIQRLAARIETRRVELEKTSGFEKQYANVVRQFFGGMARHLRELSPALKPGAQLAYVVGDQASFFQILIRTGTLLAEVAEAEGYEVDRIDLFRTRPATATRGTLREEVVVLRKPTAA